MRVIALLPNDSFLALRRALPPKDTLVRATDVAALWSGSDADRADAIVLDPAALGAAGWSAALQWFATPGAPLLLYTRLTTDSITRIVAASAAGVHEVLFRGVEDDAPTIRRCLQTLRRPAAPAQLLSKLAPHIMRLPPGLQGATVPLFCAGPVPRWGNELACVAQMPRRTVDRCLARADLEGAATVLDVARLARVWTPLVVEREPATSVAVHYGYRRLRNLAMHTRRVVGVLPSRLPTIGSEREFVARLARFVSRD